jgi:predicted lipoprotein with Yx(FWY)xxD motif
MSRPSTKHIRIFGVVGVAGAAAVLLAACSSGATGASGGSSTPPAPTTTSSSAGTTSADLSTTRSSLGSIVVDGKGRTVYLFTQDTNNPARSNCETGCDSVWSPVMAPSSGTPTLSGVDSSKVGVLTRSDGSKQLTLNGWPLYEYEGDSAAGDVKGENVQGSWFAVTPQGTKATSTSSTQSNSGYGSGGSSGSSGGW